MRTPNSSPASSEGASTISLEDRAHLPDGQLLEWISHFRVVAPLGRGGMGSVYIARDERLDRLVAIKLVALAASGSTSQRMLREAQALARLSHPNVVQVFEVGRVEGRVFIAMELVEGLPLGRWIRHAKPQHAQVIEVYRQAGRGLAAAHAAGLVHRDFKPSNAVLGDDGRVRVLDFGLAKARGSPRDPSSTGTGTGSRIAGHSLDTGLTNDGQVMGTPTYMAPEQIRGKDVTPASDQFSFCVSLYQALFKTHPFGEAPRDVLVRQIAQGQLQPMPRDPGVSDHIRAALRRGLAARPQDRWPSMDALLTELGGPSRWRSWGWLGAPALMLIVGALVSAEEPEPGPTCTSASDQLATVWNDERRARLRRTIADSGLSYAKQTWLRLQPTLEDYARRWVNAHHQACSLATAQPDADPRLDATMMCLRQRRRGFDALLDVLELAGVDAVEHAVAAAGQLAPIETCLDPDYVQAEVPPPDDPALAEQVSLLRGGLARAEAMDHAVRYDKGLKHTRELHARARELGYGPVEIEAALWEAIFESRVGHTSTALVKLELAYLAAAAIGHGPVMVRAARELAWAHGHDLEHFDEGRRWYRHGQARLDIDADPLEEAKLLSTLGAIALKQEHFDHAVDAYQRSLEIERRLLGDDHLEVGNLHDRLGAALHKQGAAERSNEHYQRALKIFETTLGPEHPAISSTLTNMGVTAFDEGHHEISLRYHLRALSIKETNLGHTHPSIAISLINTGITRHMLGDVEGAIRDLERGLAINEATHGVEHPNNTAILINLGLIYSIRGQPEHALKLFHRALIIEQSVHAEDHSYHRRLLFLIARSAEANGAPDDALAYYLRALELQERYGDPAPIELQDLLGGIAGVLEARNKPRRALPYRQRTVAYLETTGTPPPDIIMIQALCELAELELRLEQFALASGHARRALEMAGASDPDVEVMDRVRRVIQASSKHKP